MPEGRQDRPDSGEAEKKTTLSSRESELRYRRLFETAQDGILIIDFDSERIIDANLFLTQLLGYPHDELVGKTLWEIGPFSDVVRSKIAFDELKTKGSIRYEDLPLETRDGRQCKVEFVSNVYALDGAKVIQCNIRDITERKQAEEAMRRQADLLQKTFDSMTAAVFILDARLPTPTVVECNQAACAVFGYGREEMLGKTTEFLHVSDETLREFRALLYSAVEEGRLPFHLAEFHMKRKNGTIFPSEHTVSQLTNIKGERTAWVSIVRDITEHKRAEEALRESEARYRTLFDSTNDAIFIHDMGCKFLEVNKVFCELLGYSREELLQMTPADVSSPEYASQVVPRLAELRQVGHAFFESAYVRRDGTIIPIELSTRIIEYKGKPAVLSIARDITERKLTEQKLRLQSEITENMLEGVVLTRASDGVIVYVNPRFEQIFGYGPGELIGKNLAVVNAPVEGKSPEDTAREIEASMNESGAWVGEVRNVKKDGTPFWCRVSTSTLESSEYGRIWVSVQEDITESKRTAEKLDAIHKHSVQLGSENSIDEIAASTLDAIEDLLGFHYAGFEEVKDGFLQIKEARGIPASLEPLPLDGLGIVVKVARTKETIRISDTRSEPAFVDTRTKSPSGQPVRMLSELAVPVVVNGSVVAVLNVESAQLGAFTESDQVLLETLAMHVSSAIARFEQMEALRSRAEELDTLQATVLDITAPYDLSTLLERIVERAARLLGAKSGGMYLCDPEKREARCVVSYNTPHDYRGVVLKYGEGAAGRVAEAGRPLMVNDYRLWEGRAEVYEKDRPFSALLGAPMIWQDRVIGIIHVMEESKVRRFTQADLEMLMLFANHATIAVKRTRTEQELKESEERYRMMFRSMGDAVAVYEAVDQGNVFVFRDFNEAAERIEKVKSEDVIGRSILEVFPGVKDLGLFEVFQRVWKTGKPEHLPAGIYKDKRIVGWRENYVYKLPSGELVAVYQDITDRKRLEEELRQYSLHLEKLVNERAKELRSARERLEYMITSNPAVIYAGKPLADRSDFVLTYVSDRVVAMLGFEAREFIGHPEFWQHRVHLEDLRSVLAEMPRLWKEGQYSFDYRFLHKDGAYRWIREEAKVVRDADGKPIEVNGYWTDITERKHLEEALAKSQRLAAIGETSAMVGHDLRNPLQGIAGVVYLAKRNLESRKATDRRDAAGMLDTIQEQITYMDKIVSDLQDYAQPLTPKLTETNLPNLIRQTLSTVRIPKAVKVSVEVEKAAQNVMIDPTLMRRTFTNLAINAIQAMPKRGKLTVRARSKGNSTVMTVEDTGEGIPKKNLTKLFSPFFTTKAKGQGLGLAVCKRLVEAQGGTITVKSKPRKGTAFTIKMPRGKREVAS